MPVRFRFAALLGMSVAVMVWPGCSCGDDISTHSTSTGGGAGGEGGASTGGGSGGEGGELPPGVPGSDVVSAGTVAESESYRMVFTVGQSTQNQGKTTSSSYRMQGGLVGTIGSQP